MSLLKGIAEGLQAAGETVGRGFFARAQMMREDEREAMRQASLDKRWARDESRYQERLTLDEKRRGEDVAYRTGESERRGVRETRAGEKQDASMLGSSLDRLDKMNLEKQKEIITAFKDPMTGTITDQEGYNAAVSALRQDYQNDAAKIVQRSGLTSEQIDKYGFGMFLPDVEDPIPKPEITPEPEKIPMPGEGFDLASWAEGTRKAPAPDKPGGTAPADMSRKEIATDYLLNYRGGGIRQTGLMNQQPIEQQNEYLKKLRESNIQSGYGAQSMR